MRCWPTRCRNRPRTAGGSSSRRFRSSTASSVSGRSCSRRLPPLSRWLTEPESARRRSSPYGRSMAKSQRTVLMLAADQFEDMELLYPLYRMAEEGIEVVVAGLDDQPVTGKKGHGPVPGHTT